MVRELTTVPPSTRLQPTHRSLTPSERRLLGSRARSLRKRASASGRVWIATGSVVSILWLMTMLASDAPWLVITSFWIVVGFALALWMRRDFAREAKEIRRTADRLDSALRADAAEVFEVRARRFVEFEEIEDEGACYAFELDEKVLFFVSGQEFYPEARFPSLDFSLVYPRDEGGVTADFWIEKRADRAEPDRVIPAGVKEGLEIPESFAVLHADLDHLEEVLSQRDAGQAR